MELAIRKWRREDAADLAAAINNPKVQENLRDGLPYPYREQDAAEFIDFLLTSDPNINFAFAITVDDKAVGSISVTRCDNIHYRTGELGYYVAEPFWGKGIATFAVNAVCEYVFSRTDIIRIFAEPFAHNAASCRVLEKNGFTCEGVLKKNAFKNGKVLDMKIYARFGGDTKKEE